jgi:tRNA-specific 2-thiouridylase
METVVVGMSGGVDSSVSAYLLKEKGYNVIGLFMHNWEESIGGHCTAEEDYEDVKRVCGKFGIPYYSINFSREYYDRVFTLFLEEYKKGRTPNPDVLCNKEIKFKLLYDWAIKNGFDYLATGHYAGVVESIKGKGERQKHFSLVRSVDEFKDQTYFIYNIRQKQLPHILFPIGGMKKTQVRSLAQKIGLPNADKKESMGLCFVGKIRLKDFLSQKLTEKPGQIIDQTGKVIGQHQGLHNFTIGQRQGIKVGDVLNVMESGTTIKSKQTGFDINLPAKKTASLKVLSFFGDDENNEGSVCEVISGNIDKLLINKIYVEEVRDENK